MKICKLFKRLFKAKPESYADMIRRHNRELELFRQRCPHNNRIPFVLGPAHCWMCGDCDLPLGMFTKEDEEDLEQKRAKELVELENEAGQRELTKIQGAK